MKAVRTQFDAGRFGTAVATPTCSSCCCCCCCLATSMTLSSLLAQRVHKEAKANSMRAPRLVTTLAALFVPIVGLVSFLIYEAIYALRLDCEEWPRGSGIWYCNPPGAAEISGILVVVGILVLWFLYHRIRLAHPFRRAVMVGALVLAASGVEFMIGRSVLGTKGDAIVYCTLVVTVVVWISLRYRRTLRAQAATPHQAPPPD